MRSLNSFLNNSPHLGITMHSHLSFLKAVFDLTGGHVGEIHNFVKFITVYDVHFLMMYLRDL